MDLKKDVKYIKGVGPNRALLLNKLGIETLEDLITYYPRGYEDRSKPKDLIDCEDRRNGLNSSSCTWKSCRNTLAWWKENV